MCEVGQVRQVGQVGRSPGEGSSLAVAVDLLAFRMLMATADFVEPEIIRLRKHGCKEGNMRTIEVGYHTAW